MGPDVRISLIVSAHSSALPTYYSLPLSSLYRVRQARTQNSKKWHLKDFYLTKESVFPLLITDLIRGRLRSKTWGCCRRCRCSYDLRSRRMSDRHYGDSHVLLSITLLFFTQNQSGAAAVPSSVITTHLKGRKSAPGGRRSVGGGAKHKAPVMSMEEGQQHGCWGQEGPMDGEGFERGP